MIIEIKGHEDESALSEKSIDIKEIVETAENLVNDNNLKKIIYDPVIFKLKNTELSRSKKKLIFAYSLTFKIIKMD